MLLHHANECLEQPYGYVVGTVVVVAIAREVALGLELQWEACLVAHDVHLGILDCRNRVDHMREAGYARGESAAHVGVDESHLGGLIEILVVHVVDKVERLHVNGGKPLHHVHEPWHELLVCQHVALYRAVCRAHLLARLAVHATAYGIGQALGEVGARAEKLHLLARLCSAHATADAVVVAPDRAHHVVVLILYTAGLH